MNTREDETVFLHYDPLPIRLTDEQIEKLYEKFKKGMINFRGAL